MSGSHVRTHPWELSDALWDRAQPLLPPHNPRVKGGRPPREDRQMLGAILYVLRTGIQWNALPRSIGASTTVYDRFRAWERAGFFERLWAAGLAEYDELVGIDWAWLSVAQRGWGADQSPYRARRDRRGRGDRSQSNGSRQTGDQAQHAE